MHFPISNPADVRELQRFLSAAGFPVTVDGIAGPATTAAVKAFQAQSTDAAGQPLVVDGVAGAATWASLVLAQPGTGASKTGTSGADASRTAPVAGFDTGIYPGDAAMQVWKNASPYSFSGYYLASPLHSGKSWMGKRETLDSMGWQLAVVYVGRQDNGLGGSAPPDTAGGLSHGTDAIEKMDQEGFPQGSVVYLDIEPMDRIPPEMLDYVNAWLSEFTAGSACRPGIYCHHKNADDIRLALTTSPDGIPFWITGGANFVAGVSRPADSGIPYAKIWQGTIDQKRSFGGVEIAIDENTAEILPGPQTPGI